MSTAPSASDDPPELYRKHRPKNFSELIGQAEAVATLAAMGKSNKIPHALLITGPSGCGKTTIARILRTKMKIADCDFHEKNAANARGVDDIRDMDRAIRLFPMASPYSMYLLDECHQYTGEAQSVLLKMLEDPPDHVYFVLCTTDPAKLKPTIRTRCSEIKLQAVKEADLVSLVVTTATKEGKALDAAVAAKIAEVAQGSARKAMVILHQILGIPDKDTQLAAVMKDGASVVGFEIAQHIMKNTGWKAISELLKATTDEPETIRRVILGYMQSVLLNSGSKRAWTIIEIFRDPLYDIGKPGLVACCYEACGSKE